MVRCVVSYCAIWFCTLIFSAPVLAASTMDEWFSAFKAQATPAQLYGFLQHMPKGGDLHHHLTGSGFSHWWWDIATDEAHNGGYRYYTRTLAKLCNGYGTNAYGPMPEHLLFHTVQQSTYNALSDCKKSEYTALSDLTADQQSAFLDSIRLDKPYEGRNEFFETHWQRLGDLTRNPHVQAYLLLKNMQAYQLEHVTYLETQVNVKGMLYPDGSMMQAEQALQTIETMLASQAATDTGVTVRFQYALLRFLPDAEQQLRWIYAFVDAHRDRYVGINFVGREDNDKGYPLRFLPVLRELRQAYPAIALSIHAGEVDEPNHHVRDTLLLGAKRIGHGLNTISDPQTLLLMRHGPYLIEINLISNLLLEYVKDFTEHPFAEYLRTGIPVALSTDDRGMWDSTLTDEFYLAVTRFNLSWQELLALHRNSLQYAFIAEPAKRALIEHWQQQTAVFEQKQITHNTVYHPSQTGQFICRYAPKVCSLATGDKHE